MGANLCVRKWWRQHFLVPIVNWRRKNCSNIQTFSISLHNALRLSSPPSKKHIIKVIFQYSSTFLHFWVSTTNMNVEQTTSLHFVSLLLSRKSIHAPAVDVKNDFPRHETRFDGWLTRSFVYLLLLLIVGYNRLLSVRSQKWLFNLNSAQLLLLPSSIFHRSNDSEVRHERWSGVKGIKRNCLTFKSTFRLLSPTRQGVCCGVYSQSMEHTLLRTSQVLFMTFHSFSIQKLRQHFLYLRSPSTVSRPRLLPFFFSPRFLALQVE